jgi:hypothetical protein
VRGVRFLLFRRLLGRQGQGRQKTVQRGVLKYLKCHKPDDHAKGEKDERLNEPDYAPHFNEMGKVSLGLGRLKWERSLRTL